MNAHTPPAFCASAMQCSVSVVLPDDSGPIDLDDAAARQAADAEREVEAERAGGDGLDLDEAVALAELHHRALAEGALDLADRRVQRALPVAGFTPQGSRQLRHLGPPML